MNSTMKIPEKIPALIFIFILLVITIDFEQKYIFLFFSHTLKTKPAFLRYFSV